jgi:hypothetical protein
MRWEGRKVVLGYKVEKDETPYQAGLRIAEKYHMGYEFREWYIIYKDKGFSEEEAVLHALDEWDLLHLDDEGEGSNEVDYSV